MLALTHSSMTREEFRERVADFFRAGKHPRYNVPFTQTAYQPTLELLSYLRSKGFQTWICTGGGTEFVRVISGDTYGIPAQQVIGSIGVWKFETRDGKSVLVKTPELLLKNDKQDKPVGIAIQTGGTPIFACGWADGTCCQENRWRFLESTPYCIRDDSGRSSKQHESEHTKQPCENGYSVNHFSPSDQRWAFRAVHQRKRVPRNRDRPTKSRGRKGPLPEPPTL